MIFNKSEWCCNPLPLVRLILVSLLIVELTACSTRWTKDGFDIQEANVDFANCEREAYLMFPPQFVSSQLPGYTAPIQTNCSNIGYSVNCTTSGGESYPITITEDLNEGNRRNAKERCIRARGYYPVGERPNSNSTPIKNSQSNPVLNALKEAKNESDALCVRPEFAAFYKKSPCKVSLLTLEQLSDNSKVTAEDKRIISKLSLEEKEIANKVVKAMLRYGKVKGLKLGELIKKNIALADDLYLKLFNSKCTFGEFNKKQRAMDLQFVKEFKEIVASQ